MYETDLGFLVIEDKDLATLSALFGGRGLGKTFSILEQRVRNADADESDQSKFIWLRDSQEVVKKIAAGNSLTAPIKAKKSDFPDVTIERTGGNYCFVKDAKTDNYRVLGYLAALSTFHNARGISYEDVCNITWDEFIPEEGTVVKKNQGIIFLNMYESVNRNREFENKPPVQIIFLSNSEDVYSDVLEDLGISGLIENMIYKGLKEYRDDDLWIAFLESKKFHDKKANTFIYRINKNDKFRERALENKFTNNMALIKPKVNLKGSSALFTISHRYTFIQLANGDLYVKLGNWKGVIDYDMENDQEAILYRLLFNDKLRIKYIAGQMFFDSIYTQRRILEISRI